MPTTAGGSSEESPPELDPEVGLPHEDPDSPFLEDAQHWLLVYGELLTVKRALLDRAADLLSGVSDDALRAADVDQRLLRRQAERYEIRRSYWARREQELLTIADSQGSVSEEPA